MMRLIVVTGPPCSGKTTHVQRNRQAEDLVVDLDAIAHALGYPDEHADWDDNHPAIDAARVARSAVVKAVTGGEISGQGWVIDARPHPISLRIYERVGACIVALTTPLDECRARAIAAGRSASTLEQIDHWTQG